MPRTRHENYLPLDDESDSTSDSDTDSIFDSSDNEADTASEPDVEQSLEKIINDADDDDDFFKGEVRHPPEHYTTRAANLDVGRLRKKLYSDETQNRLD
jgi:hypothetical protein